MEGYVYFDVLSFQVIQLKDTLCKSYFIPPYLHQKPGDLEPDIAKNP